MLRVAVIGAGVAGLSCAQRLAEAGMRVDVFEKSRGTGGRLATRRDHGTAFDIGAQYFTARDPRFIAQVNHWEAAGACARWNMVPHVIDAQDVLAPSPDDTPRWVGTPSMTAIAQQMLSRSIALCTRTEITRVDRVDGHWTLWAGDALSYSGFNTLVVAVPAPQALRFIALSDSLKHTALGAAMEPCWAVVLGFDEPTGLGFDAAFVRDQPVAWVARNNARPARPLMPETWILHAAPTWSAEHLESPPDAIARYLTAWFRGATGAAAPAWTHAHRWRHARSEAAVPEGHHFDPALQVGICGDWCNGGRVEGAWLSGLTLAQSVLAAHRL